MYKLCKTEESAGRQERIAECLLQMMCRRTYASITVSALCETAKIPRKAFYRYFESKDDVLDILIDRCILRYKAYPVDLRADGCISPEAEMMRFFTFWKDERALLEALSRSGITGLLVERVLRRRREDGTWTGGRLSMTPHDLQDAARAAERFAIVGLFAIVIEWARAGCRVPVSEMAAVSARLLTQPLFDARD